MSILGTTAAHLTGIDGYGGRDTPIEGVKDTTNTIEGTAVEWADPVDLPVGDHTAGLFVFHVPEFNDPARHHRESISEYFAWIVEIVDEAERVLERGGKLVVIAKAQESRHPFLDVATLLLKPLREAGFQIPLFYTWVPTLLPTHLVSASEVSGLEITAAQTPPPTSSWRIVVASKNIDRRAGTILDRKQLNLPFESTIPDSVWEVASKDVWLLPTNTTGSVKQGALPQQLVTTIISLWTFVGDVIINPLAGSTVIADIAEQMNRRALCFEPDGSVLDSLTLSHS